MPKRATKAEFARRVGLTRGRISQLVAQGLPVLPDGRIEVEAGLRWMEENLDPDRRARARLHAPRLTNTRDGDSSLAEARRQHEWTKVQRARLALERERGAVVDRQKTVNRVFALARQERDAWLNWPPRIAALMAAELGVEAHAMQAALDRYVRQHLTELAEIKFEG